MTDVTVLMSVHNGETYLREAVESILRQDLEDFEFLVLNNGSTDTSPELLEAYAQEDARMRLIHQEDLGLVGSLNKGLELAQGRYIARMDADDVSLPHRLRLQAAALDANPDAGLVAGGIDIMGGDGVHLNTHYTPLRDRDLRRSLWAGNPLYHPSVMFRRDMVRELGGYRKARGPLDIEDYDLWLRIADASRFIAVPAIVLRYRVSAESISVNNKQRQTDLIAGLSDARWETGQPDLAGPGQLRTWLREYRDVEKFHYPLAYSAGLQDQLVQDNIALGFELIRRKQRLRGLRQLLWVALSGRRGCGAMFKKGWSVTWNRLLGR